MTTIDSLLAACEENHTETDRYLICADALEEDGQWTLSQAFRWCGENGKYPRKTHNPNLQPMKQKWIWLMFTEESESEFRQTYKHCTLPNEWRFLIERFGGSLKVSDSFLDAMNNLAKAFAT